MLGWYLDATRLREMDRRGGCRWCIRGAVKGASVELWGEKGAKEEEVDWDSGDGETSVVELSTERERF